MQRKAPRFCSRGNLRNHSQFSLTVSLVFVHSPIPGICITKYLSLICRLSIKHSIRFVADRFSGIALTLRLSTGREMQRDWERNTHDFNSCDLRPCPTTIKVPVFNYAQSRNCGVAERGEIDAVQRRNAHAQGGGGELSFLYHRSERWDCDRARFAA